MTDSTINSLREALKHSPENTPLRLLLADTLLNLGRIEEAEIEYTLILKAKDDLKAKTGLAKVFFRKGNFSACNVILEQIIEEGRQDLEILVLHAKGLLKENAIAKAIEIYQRVL